MKIFIKRALIFSFVFSMIYLLLIVINYYDVKERELQIPIQKNILVLGDSNTESAIDDDILVSAYNLSHSADPFFYSYLKLRKITETNKTIDTLLLSFSPHNVFENDWTFNVSHIYLRMGMYYPFMDWHDVKYLYLENAGAVISSSPAIIQQIMRNVIEKISGRNPIVKYGHFTLSDHSIFAENQPQKALEDMLPSSNIPKNLKISKKEIKYLLKIIDHCNNENLKLILINPPKRQEILNYSLYGVKEFYSYYDSNLTSIEFLDFSNLDMPDDSFNDFVHLNSKGSVFFSEFLRDNEFHFLVELYSRNSN